MPLVRIPAHRLPGPPLALPGLWTCPVIKLAILHLMLAHPIPAWILPSIAYVETRSYTDATGFHYVDQRVGKAGERGPWQVTQDAANTVLSGQDRKRDLSDPDWCKTVASAYLIWLHSRPGHPNWETVIAAYNCGWDHRHSVTARLYFQSVLGAAYGLGLDPYGCEAQP